MYHNQFQCVSLINRLITIITALWSIMCDSLNIRIGTVLNNLIVVYGIANRQSRIFVHTAKLCKEIRLIIYPSRSCVVKIPFLKP